MCAHFYHASHPCVVHTSKLLLLQKHSGDVTTTTTATVAEKVERPATQRFDGSDAAPGQSLSDTLPYLPLMTVSECLVVTATFRSVHIQMKRYSASESHGSCGYTCSWPPPLWTNYGLSTWEKKYDTNQKPLLFVYIIIIGLLLNCWLFE